MIKQLFLTCLTIFAFASLQPLFFSQHMVLAESLQPPTQVYGQIELGSNTLPVGISPALNGGVWVAEANTDSIVHIDASGLVDRTYNISTQKHLAWIWSMVQDNYGTLWIADETQPYLLRLNISTGNITLIPTSDVRPYSLAYDKESGRLWFTSFDESSLGYIDVNRSGVQLGNIIKLSGTSGIGAGPAGIALGKGGSVYVAESLNSTIDEFFPNMTLARIWYLPEGSEPVGLSLDPARNLLWFTNHASSLFGFVNLQNDSIVQYSTSVTFSQGLPIVSLPYWVHLSSDGLVWFNEHFGNKIAAFNLTGRTLTEFLIPQNDSSPLQLAVDDISGKVWFTEFTTGVVGYISEQVVQNSQNVRIISPESLSLSPFNTNFEVDVPTGSSGLLLSGSVNRLGVLNTNMSVQISASVNGTVYQITFSSPSLSYGNYTLTACIPDMVVSYSPKLLANYCSIIYLRYSFTQAQANYYVVFPVVALLAITFYYFFYQRRAKNRIATPNDAGVSKGKDFIPSFFCAILWLCKPGLLKLG
ncbi:MAG: hypothetical protein QXV32_04790 [Conexivisphaerales archaeon]